MPVPISNEDGLFSVNYELQMLAGLVTGNRLERWIEGFTPRHVEMEHFQRYEFACGFAKDCTVLDVACGTGRGSRMLAEEGGASRVVSYDLDKDTIRYAGIRNRHPNVTFGVGDVLKLSSRAEFDLIVCFETVEHVPQPEVLIETLALALKAGGRLLISTPIANEDITLRPSNPHHLKEWNCKTFRAMLDDHLGVDHLYVQHWPIYRPTLWMRIVTKLRGSASTTWSRESTQPLWEKAALGPSAGEIGRLAWPPYQVWECTRL